MSQSRVTRWISVPFARMTSIAGYALSENLENMIHLSSDKNEPRSTILGDGERVSCSSRLPSGRTV